MFVAGNDISAKEQYTKVTRSRGMHLAKNWNAKTNGCRYYCKIKQMTSAK